MKCEFIFGIMSTENDHEQIDVLSGVKNQDQTLSFS